MLWAFSFLHAKYKVQTATINPRTPNTIPNISAPLSRSFCPNPGCLGDPVVEICVVETEIVESDGGNAMLEVVCEVASVVISSVGVCGGEVDSVGWVSSEECSVVATLSATDEAVDPGSSNNFAYQPTDHSITIMAGPKRVQKQRCIEAGCGLLASL
ncbi:hypothetical protein EJ04DRAFT_512765, partial [Polyplosphaeria fusca]